MSKTFIVDTNVFIYDPQCLDNLFEEGENRVVVPSAVLEELDGLKNAVGELGYSAREALRQIEEKQADSSLWLN